MKLTDSHLWKEFVKSVSKLKNDSTSKRYFETGTKKLINHTTTKTDADEANGLDIQKYPRKTQVFLTPRREKRKFFEEARLDLHGLTKEKAEQILPIFCKKCILLEIRNIVIITGKGDGIIRQATHDWLISSPLYVVSFHPIKDSRGESGAYAVRLRKI
jgi:DNA-nicking Smr family endonuclease